MAKKRLSAKERERLDALVEEGTVDCYDDEEALAGMIASVEDELATPFTAKVIGEKVEVVGLTTARGGRHLFALCNYKGKEYHIDITSLEWVKPYPKGYEWVEAYLYFLGDLGSD